MGWTAKLEDGTVVNFGQLPVSFYEAQAAAEGVDYWTLYNQHPARSIPRWRAFCAAAKEHLGVEIPDFGTMDEFQDFTDERVTNGEPFDEEPVIDGFPPVPGRTDDGSTSTSPGVTTGPPT